MKNRVLALCLTVALLLGMMPAITMPTRAEAAAADVNVDAVFTQETITVDGVLTETSWKNATYYDIAKDSVSGSLAVVVNAGDVYVALNGNATSVSATIGGKSADATVGTNMAELCVADVAIGSFGATLVMTLTVDGTAITAAVTFTQNEINLAGAEPHYYLTNGDAASGNGTWTAYDQFTATGAYIALNTTSLSYSTISSNTTPGMSVDHSVDVEWYQQLRFDAANYPNIDAECTKTSASRGVNGIFYMCLNDSDPVNGGHIMPFVYRENDKFYLQFLLNTSTYSATHYSDPIMINDASRAYTRLKLLWHTDGSVSVSYAIGAFVSGNWVFDDYVDAGTVENATWPYTTTYTAGNDVAVGHGETANQADLMTWCVGAYKSGTTNAYVYDASVAHIPSTVAIAEGNYLGDVTVPDVVEGNLPKTVAHTYLGNLPLTWTVVDGIIAADGTVTPGLEDAVVTVTAKVGDAVVVDAKSVTVKGADKLDSLYTLETVTLDNTLSEASWKNSSWYAFGDDALSGSVAVVINKGKAYIAVKSAATSGTVKLAGKEAALTFANGVAEVAVADLGLTQFENNFVMQISVTDGASTVEAMCVAVFTKTEVNTAVGTPSYLLKHGDFTAAYSVSNSAYDYYRADGSQVQFANSTSLDYINITSTATPNFSVDHSMDVEWMQEIQFDHSNFPNIDPNSTKTGANRGISRIFYMCLNDSDATYGGHIFPFIYRENDVYWLQFLLPTSNNSVSYYSDPIQINDASQPRTRLKLLWHTDGSVSVTYSLGGFTGSWNFGEEVYAGTVENVTWSNTGSFTANTTVGVGTAENATQADIASWCLNTMQDGSLTQMYLYDTQLTHIAKTAAIQDGNYFGSVDVPDVVNDDLPTSVTHAYFGDLALTWSDNDAGYVSANGAIRLPEIDTVVTLTAYADSTKVLEKEVTIKAAEKLAALATAEAMAADGKLYEVSWRYAAWKEIGGNVPGSVAVLMKGGEAYVAIKSATATSATVTLGETTLENVPFVDGAVEIKIADASIDTLQEKLAVAVALSDGTNTAKLKCSAVVLDKQKVNATLAGTGITMKSTEYAGVTNGTNWTASNHSDFVNNSRLFNNAFLAVTGTNNPALAINHNNDIYIEWNMWVGIMAVSDGLITDTGSAVNKSEGFYFQAQDSEGSAVIHAIIYRADEAGNLKARVLKADKTCSDPIDLGITVENAEGAARVGFLWATDGSVSVLVNGEVKGVVDDASITAAKSTYLAPNSTDRVFFQNVAAEWATFFLYGYSFLNVTGEPMDVVTQQVAIGDDLSFNFATNVGAGTASATVNGQAVEADAEGNISINLAAAQMNDVVELTVADDSGMTVTKEYTVRDYALTILNDNTGAYDEVKPLVEAMLHYGAAAQTYFEYNDDALVTDGLNLTAPTAAPVAGTAANITDGGLSDLGIKYYGASLLFKNKTTLRFYFEVEGDIAAAAFYIGGPSGTPVTPKQSGESNFYYIDIVDINPQDLDNQVTIFATDVEYGGMLSASVTYSPANYMVNIYNSANSSAALKQLMVAMYNYNLAANAYVA